MASITTETELATIITSRFSRSTLPAGMPISLPATQAILIAMYGRQATTARARRIRRAGPGRPVAVGAGR